MTTIYGWDMSHYDNPSIGTSVKEGYQFITHKAGGDATDNEYDDWWGYAKKVPESDAVLGAYWVLYPGNAAKRADLFLERLDAASPGWRSRNAFMLQVDCERWNGSQATIPGKSDIKAFCDRLVARTGGRYRPIVYAPKWVYGDSLAGLGYPLWSSAYPISGPGYGSDLYARAGGDSGPGWKAYSGQVPAVWQFTSSATIAGQTTCDANAFRGSLASLKSLVTPIALPPTPGRTTMKITTSIPELHEGDDDAKLDGYNLIGRIQRLVGVPDDGQWGPHTTAGIADWCDMKPAQCKKLTEDIYRKVFGAGR